MQRAEADHHIMGFPKAFHSIGKGTAQALRSHIIHRAYTHAGKQFVAQRRTHQFRILAQFLLMDGSGFSRPNHSRRIQAGGSRPGQFCFGDPRA